MKSKKGFTLVELLAVIAILAILMLIAIPNVINLYRNARKNTFKSDVQSIIRASEQQYVMNSMNNGNRTCFDSTTNPLEIEARDNLVYVVRLSNKGKITSIEVVDNNYQIIIDDSNGISKDEIGKSYQIENRNKTTDIISCNNSFLVEGEEGTGEENTPYKIQYIEDLVELSEKVNSGETYAGKTIILSRDLDFKNKDSYKDKDSELYTQLTTGNGFTPIKTFSGTFDGKNHRIDNLYIYNNKGQFDPIGFMGTMVNGTIKNLTIGGNIKTDYNNDSAGIVAQIANSTIDNCVNEINIEVSTNNSYSIGGLTASVSGNSTIKNSINKANLTLKSGAQVGGLVGCVNSAGGNLLIENSNNEGNIISSNASYVGGIIGRGTMGTVESSIIIKNSYNDGEINANSIEDKSINIGGIIGYSNDTTSLEINNSGNNSNITNLHTDYNNNVELDIGGIVGKVNKGKIIKVNNSYNKGNINTNMYENIDLNIQQFFGGIVGKFNSMPEDNQNVYTITNTYNTGDITGGNRLGGIIGGNIQNVIVIVDNCYNSGNLSSDQNYIYGAYVGGLIGSDHQSSKTIILNSYNKGNLKSLPSQNSSTVGGIVAAANDGNGTLEGYIKIINSYNLGNIIGKYNERSYGISRGGSLDKLLLNNVYSVGNVTSNDNKTNYAIGNLVNDTYTINNTYYKNDTLKNGTNLSNDSTLTIGKPSSEMKNQSFVTLLNTNKNSINLTEIDSNLSDYTLCDWKLGISGYPEFDCK